MKQDLNFYQNSCNEQNNTSAEYFSELTVYFVTLNDIQSFMICLERKLHITDT